MRFDDEVQKQLQAVVGDSFDPPRRWGPTLAKWLVAALLAVGASAAIVGILHQQVMQAQTAPAPAKPVQVQILPAEPARK